jgi:hypothetical protein
MCVFACVCICLWMSACVLVVVWVYVYVCVRVCGLCGRVCLWVYVFSLTFSVLHYIVILHVLGLKFTIFLHTTFTIYVQFLLFSIVEVSLLSVSYVYLLLFNLPSTAYLLINILTKTNNYLNDAG